MSKDTLSYKALLSRYQPCISLTYNKKNISVVAKVCLQQQSLENVTMSYSEKDIRERISEIDEALEKLTAERHALQNLVYMSVAKARTGDVYNKRSYKRIYNEEKIKLAIQAAKKGIKLSDLVRRLMNQGVIIKESTLRSYLSRMAKRGDLSYNPHNHTWNVVLV